jgi:DNA-binding response OmpR family regulator
MTLTKQLQKPQTSPSSQRIEPKRLNALIVEDDQWMQPVIFRAVKEASPHTPFKIDWVNSAEDGFRKVKVEKYSLIIADIFLKGSQIGLEFWNWCRTYSPETSVLLISGLSVDAFLRRIGSETVCPAFLPKPFKFGECRQVLEGLLSYTSGGWRKVIRQDCRHAKMQWAMSNGGQKS